MTIAKKTIIITGASSGLGAALAIEYANINVRLFLFGRSEEKLLNIELHCKARHAEVRIVSVDVQNQQLMHDSITKICQEHKVDIIIACAGVSAGTLVGPETSNQVNKILNTNLHGSLHTIIPALPFMIKNKSGNIVIISSMAGLIGLSSAPSYSASKAAVKIFGDALRGYLQQFKVKVSVVIPGYIDTPMTAVNDFPMPFKISAAKAARIIIQGVQKDKPVIAFPLIIYILLKLVNLLPTCLIDYINSKLPGKPAFD
ncbi:SDR family oxidoreductase [Candidatus Trichorickettsia mobilis]|uniref:SDR family oxidoreductase n=1 Tax=Candidatus Trichorickettsia mobilis TaxID=1346319 RepID=A0ABZ0UTA0_9RICK|nr:SDR family NAD(P)-dependent oxidoreductase [Candidatus Trichorickettsia mobilis]WPY01260.1 SDR family oxidoreductase [Candidatus Trichorickettsia mobilis]